MKLSTVKPLWELPTERQKVTGIGFSSLTQSTETLGIWYCRRVRPEVACVSMDEPWRTENWGATTLCDQAVTRPCLSNAALILVEFPGRKRS